MKLISKLLELLTTESLIKLLNHTVEQHEYIFQQFHAFHVNELVTSNADWYEHQSGPCWILNEILNLIIIEPMFKRVATCLIIISRLAVNTWVIAKFTIPDIWIVRIGIFIPYVSLKLKHSKKQSGYFVLKHPLDCYFSLVFCISGYFSPLKNKCFSSQIYLIHILDDEL